MSEAAQAIAPRQGTLIIACGAIARELNALRRANGWRGVRIRCLPADLHNRPERIPAAVRELLEQSREAFAQVFVAYADCGTGGRLDRVLQEFGVERLPGAHCYEFFAGAEAFAALSDEEPGTFFLTDFLVRHFDALVRRGLGLDRHPELHAAYFGHYRRALLLSQTNDAGVVRQAQEQARFLGLEFAQHHTGLAPLDLQIRSANPCLS